MNAKARRKIEMGMRALEFSRGHPDASPGYTAALARLEEQVARAAALAEQQRTGLLQVRNATARKRELQRAMMGAHLDHLAQVGKAAAKEVPDLARTFVHSRVRMPYLAFRTAARGMAAEAQANKELLVKHGLSDTVLTDLSEALDAFDQAIEQGTSGRDAHVGASSALNDVADEIVQVVSVMDGLNRLRFARDSELLSAWESASNVVGPFRAQPAEGPVPAPTPGTPPTGGEIRPAA